MNIVISFITVNYNGISDTCKLIDSIYLHLNDGLLIVSDGSAITCEIIVVDNNKKSGELELIKKKYPNITSIQNPDNSGFAAGNNLGISKANGDYLFFINNDVQLRDDSFKYLIDRVLSSPKIAGASPKILSARDGNTIQYAGYTPLSKITMRNKTIGLNEQDIGKYNVAHTVPYIHGAAFLIRKDVVEKIGGWPESYFLYYEELDWSEQIRRAGYELWYEPMCTVYHSGSASIGINSPVQVFYMTRNRMIFAKRNFNKLNAFLSIVYQMCIAVPKQCVKFALNGKFTLIATSAKACCSISKEGKVNF
ncbi:MAG: glycosyltransferase family 2 protein [Bacteroidales bacterium]|nr:glycosyltransferase family 2 protein [Bacteroidales bacterium]MCI1734014.1 glycosyltransferase family 2 protein [Bacteroidales bacterium]